eukprot:GHRR01022086.1.p1 GENE.GHRR01022086.1~~GHRR01022086.1.p1  ORF type:complete len:102 (+),score=26.36 GHRR01022086.1:754-1059(+)
MTSKQLKTTVVSSLALIQVQQGASGAKTLWQTLLSSIDMEAPLWLRWATVTWQPFLSISLLPVHMATCDWHKHYVAAAIGNILLMLYRVSHFIDGLTLGLL